MWCLIYDLLSEKIKHILYNWNEYMIEIKFQGNEVLLKSAENVEIKLDTQTNSVTLGGFDVTYPGEYEKSGLLLEVKEYESKLFYHFVVDSKHLVIVNTETLELKEEIVSFFGDVDILLIHGSKASAKLFENIEAKVVVPFGEGKDIFLNTLGQHIEETPVAKIKSEMPLDNTEFYNIEIK